MAIDATRIQEAEKLKLQGLSIREIARRLGVSFGTAKKACSSVGTEEKASWSEGGDTATWSITTRKPIKTLDDAIKVSGVDLTVWQADRWEHNSWTVIAKDASDTPQQYQNYQVKVFWKRAAKKCIKDASDAIFERMKKHSPKYPNAFKKRRVSDPYLVVAGLFDSHFGKYAWGEETGSNYDIKIAESVFSNAVDDIVNDASHRQIGKWLLPIGNDFFHMDNSRNTTFAGTQLDVDGRYARVIEAGEMAVIKAIERMIARASVDVVWVPGNHDPTTSYHLCRTVDAWFRNAGTVHVDYSPSPRKYYRWGKSLIGLTHGNEEKIHELPNLMATERPVDWSECRSGSREWLIGHWHSSRRWVTKDTESSGATVIRGLMSLSGTDAWHHRRGYVGTKHAAEAYYYKKNAGYAGHVPAYTRAIN